MLVPCPRSLSQEGSGQSQDLNRQLSVSRAVPNSGQAIVVTQRPGPASLDIPAQISPAGWRPIISFSSWALNSVGQNHLHAASNFSFSSDAFWQAGRSSGPGFKSQLYQLLSVNLWLCHILYKASPVSSLKMITLACFYRVVMKSTNIANIQWVPDILLSTCTSDKQIESQRS